MGTSAKSVPSTTVGKTWGTMNGKQKLVLVGKVSVMVCTFGYVYGGVLVEGMTYETYPSH